MTREEAIKILKDSKAKISPHDLSFHFVEHEKNEALDMAIKALEQEPCDYYDTYNKTCRRSEVPKEPCEDAISRKAVEKITWEEPSYTDALNVLTEVSDKIRELPSATPQTRWIPVSERLPEKNVEVLVTTKYDEIAIAELYGGNDWFIHKDIVDFDADAIVA